MPDGRSVIKWLELNQNIKIKSGHLIWELSLNDEINNNNNMSNPIGIDLGTTYSAIAKWKVSKASTGSEVYYLALENQKTLASKVFIEDDEGKHNFLVGRNALKKGVMKPDQFITAVKRDMDDINKSYEVLGRSYSPIDISSEIIKNLLRVVEGIEGPGNYLPKGIVVTVPHYFGQVQNLNTKEAALKAIRELYESRTENPEALFLGLLPEPIAAGLDYVFSQLQEKSIEDSLDEVFLVFDLGGGTFDITVFRTSQKGNELEIEVLAIAGDSRLGGEDFDNSLNLFICKESDLDIDSIEDEKQRKRAKVNLIPQVTSLKEVLSNTKINTLVVPNVIDQKSIDMEVKRKEFEDCINGNLGDERNYIGELELKINTVIEKSEVSKDDVTCVLLVGGSSKIPAIKDLIIDNFGEDKVKQIAEMDLAVSRGAAVYAAFQCDQKLIENGKEKKWLGLWDKITIKEVTAHKLGLHTKNGFYTLIKDNSITPAEKIIPTHASNLSDDNKYAQIDEITILQGSKDNHVPIGIIPLGKIHAHGRSAKEIPIKITLIANSTLVKVKVHIPQGNEDKSDIVIDQDLSLENS